MAKHQWTIVCTKSIIDKDNNTVSLIEVIEELNVTKPETTEDGKTPKIPINLGLQIVSLWYKADVNIDEEDRTTARIIIKDPDGKVVIEQPYDVVIGKGLKRSRFLLQFHSFPLTSKGTYRFIVQQKNETKKSSRWVNEAELFIDIGQNKTH